MTILFTMTGRSHGSEECVKYPKPKGLKAERTEKRRHGRVAYLTARAEYLINLAREQGRLRISDLDAARMLITPRASLKKLSPSEYPLCEMQLPETNCDSKQRQARDIHHKRGRIGDDYIDQSKFVGCCRACHDYVERNRKFGVEHGWIEPRNTKGESNV